MRAVLGIDAAWTLTQPSGIALVVETIEGWHLNALAPSYQRFHACADDGLAPEIRPTGSRPDAAALLDSCSRLCGRKPDLVAIDMPLSVQPIEGRRCSDNAVSRAYGNRQCGTHTPSSLRPGLISGELRIGFEAAGYPLQTVVIAPPGLIEVYPHPALVELANAAERLPYKAAKVRRYWPDCKPEERRVALYSQWRKIIRLLEDEISGVAVALPELAVTASGTEVKSYEDMLDAIVCAWVAICALNGRAAPFGDRQSAIWIPEGGTASTRLTESSAAL